MYRIDTRALFVAAAALSMPMLAGATPQVSTLYTEAAQNSSQYRQGAWVRQLDDWGIITQAVIHHTDFGGTLGPGLYREDLGGASPSVNKLTDNFEEPEAGDLHGGVVAYSEFTSVGGSELYALVPGVSTNVCAVSNGTPVIENHPAVHNNRIVWQSGTEAAGWEIMLNQFHPTSCGTTTQIGVGERPAIWSNLVAWEEAGDITVYDAGTTSSISSADELYLPSIGGSRIFYERFNPSTGVTDVAYRAYSDLSSEHVVNGPCAEHFRPRVSGNGQYLLYTGIGCPLGDGAQPLYLTYIRANGAQTTYLVEDLGFVYLHRSVSTPYDIDEDVVAYQVDNGVGGWDLLASRIDTTQL